MKIEASTLAAWRGRVFLAAWTLYAGYYMCRKDIASPTTEAGVEHFAMSLTCFGATYALGQFAGGELADRFGARPVALSGAGISILCTILMTWCVQPALGFGLILQLGNGFGQGLGWPSLLKLIGGWFRRGERDIVLGWWSTSYILGGLLATSLTAWLVVHTGIAERTGFHPAYIASSALLILAALFFYRETSHLPDSLSRDSDSHDDIAVQSAIGPWKRVVANRNIRIISAAYFFLKMTRYTLLFWLPRYLVSSLGRSHGTAEHAASYFELFGFVGPLLVAYTLQRRLGGRHLTLGAGMLFALAFLCLLHPMMATSGGFAVTISIALMGILIYGADVLMSGMAVLDSVHEDLHGRAAGFVNGVGSIGQMISPLLVTVFVSRLGWTRLFDLFVFFALVAGAICAFGPHQLVRTSESNRSDIETSFLPL
jgi:sugar phosphate permease